MIADLKPYAEYKESGLPWATAVPSHWVIKRGKSYLVAIDQRSKAGREELLTVSSARGVVPRSSANVTMFKAESYAGHKLCWPGDLVINSLWAWGGGLGVSKHHGIISTAYSVYRSRVSAQINPRFLHELVRSSAFHWELQVRSKGVWISRLQLTDTSFLDAPIPLPPPTEQAAIVRFLDWANGRLERAIRAKRKVIALLNEQKQAIVHRAVTRGLDASAPLRPSGISWLGEIPQHWEVSKFKHLLSAPLAYGVLKPDKYSGPDAVSIIRILDLARGTVDSSRLERISPQLDNEFKRTRVKPGEVIISLVGTIGRSAIIPAELPGANLSRALCRVQLRADIAAEFVIAYTQSRAFLDQADAIPAGTAQRVLNLGDLKQFWVGLPTRAEQAGIVSALGHETQSVDAAIARLEREIELLREYRTRLVADLVTGKLDVREAAARLSDEAPLDIAEADADLTDEPETANEEAAV